MTDIVRYSLSFYSRDSCNFLTVKTSDILPSGNLQHWRIRTVYRPRIPRGPSFTKLRKLIHRYFITFGIQLPGILEIFFQSYISIKAIDIDQNDSKFCCKFYIIIFMPLKKSSYPEDPFVLEVLTSSLIQIVGNPMKTSVGRHLNFPTNRVYQRLFRVIRVFY